MHRTSVALLAALAFAAIAGCRTLVPVDDLVDLPLGPAAEGSTLDDVSEAIWRAGRKRGWRVEPLGPGELRGTLRVRSHVAVVTILHDMRRFSIRYADSRNLRYDGREIHPRYASWVKRLADEIRQEPILARAPRHGSAVRRMLGATEDPWPRTGSTTRASTPASRPFSAR